MNIRLIRELHYRDYQELPKGVVGEAISMTKNADGLACEFQAVFYGYPGVYTVRAEDLENL